MGMELAFHGSDFFKGMQCTLADELHHWYDNEGMSLQIGITSPLYLCLFRDLSDFRLCVRALLDALL